MSDSSLRYIPVDPTFQPTQLAALSAAALLHSFLPQAETIDSKFFDSVRFVDAGGNWSGVHCPSCGADIEPWWADAVSEAWKTDFTTLQIRSRCCETTVSLNDLDYGWPVGFASYVLEAANPSSKGLSPSQLAELETKLGCAIREIPAHH
jgi:hypothetical protein